jgi:orotate phosphoribosyltransferase
VLPEGPRTSGLQRAVEGNVHGQVVVLFDNVASTGTSIHDAARQVAKAGGTVAGALVISTYDAVLSLSFPLRILLNFRDLINAAHEAGTINTARRNRILRNT